MKIELIPRENPIKKRHYKLTHKYKLIVQKEIEGILHVGIIYPIDKEEWVSPMLVQPKKHDPKKLRICVYFQGLNKETVTYLFPNCFADEIINEVIGHECYSFTYGLLGYNQVPIAK